MKPLETENKIEGKEYVITFPISEQITECEWIKRYPVKKITPETTVAELISFYRKFNKVGVVDLQLREIEQ